MQRRGHVEALGDSAVLVCLGSGIDLSTHLRVKRFSDRIEGAPFPGFIESVPAYASVAVHYDVAKLARWLEQRGRAESPLAYVTAVLDEMCEGLDGAPVVEQRTVEIPVSYGGTHGPDLVTVARHAQLSPEEVIALHLAGDYRVYMIGFMPGFPYLGGMSERIAAPRKETPPTSVPAGSVGVAGGQTGIYPIESPGGWQIIGRTPERLFLPERMPPALLRMGDSVRFFRIDEAEFDERAKGAA